MMPRRYIFGVLVLAALAAGCDSTEPISENPQPATDVAGSYQFETYSFQPKATVLPAYNLLDTLAVADTELILADSREFVLQYRFKGGQTRFISGEFSNTPTQVVLRAGSDQNAKFNELLLANNLVLLRSPTDPALLTLDLEQTVDVGKYSSRFAGLGPISGVLKVRLRR